MTDKQTCILNEFQEISFRDKRLDERFEKIMLGFGANPSGIISKVFVEAKEQKAAYRFLRNEKITFETMLDSHQKKVKQRSDEADTILAIQDSTSLHLTGAKKVSDIGCIGDLKQNHPGLNIHTSLFVTPKKEVLGISDLQVYDRFIIKNKNKTHCKLHALEKETGKWLRGIKNTRMKIGKKANLVWIADREGDFWDYFAEMEASNELFVQRVTHKRKITESNKNYFEYLKDQPILDQYSFTVDGRGGQYPRKTKTVCCEVRTAKITMKKPRSLPRSMKSFEAQAIHVVEKGTESPLEWFLITNIPCKTAQEVIEKIQWYQIRWTIEELHKVVKSGCGVEEMRLENKDRLQKYLLILFIVALRILWMTKLSKSHPETPCTEVFSDEEWTVLYIKKYKKKPKAGYVPSIKEIVRLLGSLGGFYEYNKKATPGTVVIWRGMNRLSGIIEGMELLREIQATMQT